MKKNNTLKILAVIIAVIVWLMMNLLKDQTATINLPIRIVNVPSSIYLFENEQITIPVMIHGTGIHILLFYLTAPSIDYNGSDLVMGSNLLDIDRIHSSLPYRVNISLTAIPIDNSFLITTDRILQKRVPVVFDFFSDQDKDILLENNYTFDDIFVTISGPSIEIQRIDSAFSEKISSDILQRRARNVHLKPINEHIVIIPSFIELTQTLDVVITRTLSFIPIRYDRTKLSIFPDRVSIIIEGQIDAVNAVTVDDIRAYVQEDAIDDQQQLEIHFTKPDFINIIDFTPNKVTVF